MNDKSLECRTDKSPPPPPPASLFSYTRANLSISCGPPRKTCLLIMWICITCNCDIFRKTEIITFFFFLKTSRKSDWMSGTEGVNDGGGWCAGWEASLILLHPSHRTYRAVEKELEGWVLCHSPVNLLNSQCYVPPGDSGYNWKVPSASWFGKKKLSISKKKRHSLRNCSNQRLCLAIITSKVLPYDAETWQRFTSV